MIKELYYAIRYGKWSWGYGSWEGKPMLGLFRMYYDGWHYAIHVGKLWIECD